MPATLRIIQADITTVDAIVNAPNASRLGGVSTARSIRRPVRIEAGDHHVVAVATDCDHAGLVQFQRLEALDWREHELEGPYRRERSLCRGLAGFDVPRAFINTRVDTGHGPLGQDKMAHTLCFSGMDRAEEAKLKLLFADANEWLGGDWTVAPENMAEVLVIDLESIYGHMAWLKVRNSGRYVIALTSRPEAESEHLLLRPVTVDSMVTALAEAIGKPVPPQQPRVSASDAMATAQQAGAAIPQSATRREMQMPRVSPDADSVRSQDAQARLPRAPSRIGKPLSQLTSASAQQSQPIADTIGEHAATIQTVAAAAAHPDGPPALASADGDVPAPPLRAPQPRSARERPESRDPVLWDYLHAGKLAGPAKLELASAPPLVIDPKSDTYIGGINLKPYSPYFELGSVRIEQWQSLSADELRQLSAQLGGAQPLARLRWLHALVQGGGALAPGYDPGDKFRLTRWPKTEREFPRHFRIATVMMQGPATLAEIAAQSNTTRDEVTDFVNASLDSGFAEPYTPPPEPSVTPPKSGGLLGRLRGR